MSIPTFDTTLHPSPACLSRIALIGLLAFSGIPEESLAEPNSQTVPGKRHAVSTKPVNLIGKASWYGPGFHGKKTASGARFNQHRLTAAHRHLPLGTKVIVTNLQNGKQVRVTINDRGPSVKGYSIGLSRAAAKRLEIEQDGVALVRTEARPQLRAEPGPQTVPGKRRAVSTKPVNRIGKASWYGPGFHGKKTASGEQFNQHRLTAAHRRLPLGTKVMVTNLKNGRKSESRLMTEDPL